MWKRRILGVDVGSTSIKLAQVEVSPLGARSLRRLAICGDQDELAGLLQLKDWWKAGDRLHLGYPSDRIIVRQVKLPFQETDKIRKTLPFELEGEVPFSVEEIVAGHLVRQKGPDGTEILAVASTVEEVGGWLERFKPLDMDPEVLEPELTALAHFSAAPDPSQTVAILEMGASKTNLVLLRDGQAQALRCIRQGLGDATPRPPLPEAMLQEIRLTLTALHSRGDIPWPDAFYLCGGGAAIPEVAGWLEDHWGTPVRLLSPLEAIPSLLEEPPAGHPARFSTAIGLALGAGSDTCNLRAGGVFAYHAGLFVLRGRALAAGILLLLATLTGMGDLYAHLAVRNRTLAAYKEECRRLFQQAFPGGGHVVEPAVQMRRLLDERKASQLSLLGQDPRSSAVEILREISLRVQAATPLRLRELDLKDDLLSLRGEASGYHFVEKAKDQWQESPLLEGVEIKNAKKNPKTQLWEFQCVARRKLS